MRYAILGGSFSAAELAHDLEAAVASQRGCQKLYGEPPAELAAASRLYTDGDRFYGFGNGGQPWFGIAGPLAAGDLGRLIGLLDYRVRQGTGTRYQHMGHLSDFLKQI